MTKQPFQIKNLVEEWSKQFGYTIKETTRDQVNAPIEWTLEISNGLYTIGIFSPKNSDLLRFQSIINFADEHRQKIGSMPNEEYNKFVLNMTDRLSNLGCDWVFGHDTFNQKQMNTLTMMYFLTYDSADKNAVLQLINKALINQSQILRVISLTLNKGGEPQGTSMQSNNKSIYG